MSSFYDLCQTIALDIKTKMMFVLPCTLPYPLESTERSLKQQFFGDFLVDFEWNTPLANGLDSCIEC